MQRRILLTLLILTALSPLRALTPDQRREYLAKLQAILPAVPSFSQWLEKTGELPPISTLSRASTDFPIL